MGIPHSLFFITTFKAAEKISQICFAWWTFSEVFHRHKKKGKAVGLPSKN